MPFAPASGVYPQYGIGEIIGEIGQLGGQIADVVQGIPPTSPNIQYPFGYPFRGGGFGIPPIGGFGTNPVLFDTNSSTFGNNTILALGILLIIGILVFKR